MGASPTAEPDRHVVVRGVRLGLNLRGEGNPMLSIHGFPLNRTMWFEQLDQLQGIRCIAPDLRGFGRSDPVAPGWTMADYADDLVALLDGVGAARAVVCALSMGGYIAFEMWRRHPNRVRALVLANTRAGADSLEGRKQRDATIDSVRRRGIDALVETMTPKLVAPVTLKARPQLVAHVRGMIADTAAESAIAALIALRDRADATDLLEKINVPTLVIAGAEDAIIPVEIHREFARRIPRADFQIIEGAGHLTPMEQPQAFNGLLAGFLKSIE